MYVSYIGVSSLTEENMTHDDRISKVNILNRQFQPVFTKADVDNIPDLDDPQNIIKS